MVFEHYGFLCTHVFCIMKKLFLKHISSKYLLRRWKKDITNPEELKKNYSVDDRSKDCQMMVFDRDEHGAVEEYNLA